MHRFWSELDPQELAAEVQGFFKQHSPVDLEACEHVLLGPKQVAAAEISLIEEIKQLHMELYDLLNNLGVTYTAPAWVGDGYRAHVTDRADIKLEVGTMHRSTAVYLIEVQVPGHNHKRFVRIKFES